MDWAIYLSQLANPFVGAMGAIPLALGVLNLPAPAVWALVAPVHLAQVLVVHAGWQWIAQRPRVHAWFERRRSERVSAWLDHHGAFVAAIIATLVLGPIPTYVTLRYLGVPLARMWYGVGLACAFFGAVVTGICTAAGL